jgi:hypothetical protein
MKVALLALTLAMSVHANSSEPGRQSPDWSKDQFLIGTWACDLARPGRAPAHERAVYSFGLGDQWLKLTYTLTPGETGEKILTTEAYETFDAKLKLWVYTSFRSDGDFGTAYSRGWAGTTKTYGPLPGSKDKWRLVQTQLDNDHVVEIVEIGKVGGSWERVSELRCQRSK